ncbi:MAG TPA: hypothetical protein VLE89_02975 [Chlamydiales bacterium]|nr:hypothetical protein [Chlamydiales bacterium]
MRWFFLLFIPFLHAQEEEEPDDLTPHFVFTSHKIELPSGPLEYSAVTGTLPLFDEAGNPCAEIFFIAFNKENDPDRPITFVFPGGPGGAGTLEAIVSYGPRRLLTAGEGRSILPPYKIIDNPETLLEYTDLVFVDPVNCGYSTAANEDRLPIFYSVEGDIHSLGEFVRTYVASFKRWNSPKYLAGGSYGTPRCCGLALNLLQYDIAVSGVILHGCAMDYSSLISERANALPDCLLIPTFAATAHYYGRFWPDRPLSEVIDYARRFAFDDYAPAMLQPSRLNRYEKEGFYQKLAELSGLPIATIQRYNGRINESIYTAEFFAPERKVLGGTDTRYSGDVCAIDPDHDYDPSNLDSIGIQSAFLSYLQKELETDLPFNRYVGFSTEAISRWNFGTYDSITLPDLFQRLRLMLVVIPQLKVFVGSGYYDCRTPFAATEYCFDHLELPYSYKKNLQFEYYEAGHGFILDHKSLQKLKKDLTHFYVP